MKITGEQLRSFGRIEVKLVPGDISERKVDVIVNAANNRLNMGGGVAASIRSRGGIEIHKEAIAKAPAALGAVVKTGAGKLYAGAVYHAVIVHCDAGKEADAATVETATRGVLELAGRDDVGSIAIPVFGAGVGGLDLDLSLGTILRAIEEEGDKPGKALTVEIAVKDPGEFEKTVEAFSAFQPKEDESREVAAAAEEFLAELEGKM